MSNPVASGEEPTIDEIVSSIKKVIAEGGADIEDADDSLAGEVPAQTTPASVSEAVLQLTEADLSAAPTATIPQQPDPVAQTVSPPPTTTPVTPAPVATPPNPTPAPTAPPVAALAATGPPAVSSAPATAPPAAPTPPSLGSPSNAVPASLEAMIAEALTPVIAKWVDAHLRTRVQELVAESLAEHKGSSDS
ncbi:MAG: hypothetical protein AAF442_06525 [Pseudomonadota bacterium]